MKIFISVKTYVTISLSVLSFFLLAHVAWAATITVNNGTSTIAVDGGCSLREAIQNANDNAATNTDCTAGSGIDTLVLTTSISLTVIDHVEAVAANFAVPNVTESLVIDGGGFTIARSGVSDMQLLLVTGGDISLSISDAQISNFSLSGDTNFDGALDLEGAGLGTLLLDHVTFDGNTGGVIHSGMGGGTGDWTITHCIFTNNAISGNGGIINSAPVRNFTLSDSTFSGNSATSGVDGGVITFLDGAGPGGPYTISISDSTFSNNTTTGFGGVLGISSYFPTLIVTIDNSTFESNTAANGGGVLSIEGGTITDIDFTLSHSTFSSNTTGTIGGAIYIQDGVDVTMTNNTFWGNISATGGGAITFRPNGAGDNSVAASFNTFSGNSDTSGTGTDIYQLAATSKTAVFENNIFNSGGDECGGTLTNYTFTNNLSSDTDCGSLGAVGGLVSLTSNGGGVQTAALVSGSNAINASIAGTLGCPATDARGVTRPFGSSCDLGAFEYVLGSATVTESSGTTSVVESGMSDSYTVVLDRAPLSSVTITPVFSYGKISVTPASLTFTTSNWATPQTFAVTAVHDSGVFSNQTDTITHTVSSVDPAFEGITIGSVSVTIINVDEQPSGGGSSAAPVSPIVPSIPVPPISPVLPVTPAEPIPPVIEPTPVTPPPEQQDMSPITNPPSSEAPSSPSSEPHRMPSVDHFFESVRVSSYDVFQAVSHVVSVIPQKTSVAVSAVGVAIPTIVTVVTQPAVVANVVSIPLRLWNLIPVWLGLRRKKRPWGTVYDSVTKQPLDPVYVSLRNQEGNVVATTVTDLDGRFGFLVPPGRYFISARKDDYVFPSQKLSGHMQDDLYNNLYFGEEIVISGDEDLVIKNIPMDSKTFNWNEFEKSRNKSLMRFYSRRELFLARSANILFWIGFAISLGALFHTPTTLNDVLFGVYALVLLLRSLGVKPKKPGYITERATGFPLSFGIVKVVSELLGKEIAHTVIGKTGKYYLLVPRGTYYVTIEKKIGEDAYEQVFQSKAFKTKKGYIGNTFKI